ncbi:hypothetical protein ZWY2020_052508 [Hordeum vulgare]|nr:hypothetical protein ZWY2020_052508 [Hordeum vulgare]
MADGSLDAEVVIVGGGIAGLATAVALQRAGVAPGGSGIVVLERHPELRATGTAMTVFPNGWFALRAFGVADKLVKTDRSRVTNLETGTTQVFRFAGNKVSENESGGPKGAAGGASGGAAPRHRPLLIQARLHRYRTRSRRLVGGHRPKTGRRRSDPSKASDRLRRRALRGGAVVDLSDQLCSGRSTVRGLSVYPGGHGLKQEIRQYLSDGIRAGLLPISKTGIYWYLVNKTIPQEREAGADPCGRNPWAVLTSKADRGPVTVAGDAFHPMTPEMAQGGCSALEDAVVLARALSRATTPSEGLAAYVAKRRVRAAWLVAVAYVSGWVQHGGTC